MVLPTVRNFKKFVTQLNYENVYIKYIFSQIALTYSVSRLLLKYIDMHFHKI